MAIKITQGDSITMNLTATTDGSTLFDLTGAVFTSQVIGKANDEIVEFADSKHTEAADQTADKGEFTLTLSATDTALLKVGKRDLLTKVVQGATVTHFHGIDAVEILAARPLK